jgi:hypothetical protein
LYREESEGFAKLIALLHPSPPLNPWPPVLTLVNENSSSNSSMDLTSSASSSSSATPSFAPKALSLAGDASTAVAVVAHVRSLIGHFRLDPNRCIDVVMDAFLADPLHPGVLNEAERRILI